MPYINMSKARGIISSLPKDESPYSALRSSLEHFEDLTFSDRIKLICSCSIPTRCLSCTVIVMDEIDTYDDTQTIMARIIVDGKDVGVINATSVFTKRITHQEQIEMFDALLRLNNIFESDRDYTIMLIL